jgi:hypothetical protein
MMIREYLKISVFTTHKFNFGVVIDVLYKTVIISIPMHSCGPLYKGLCSCAGLHIGALFACAALTTLPGEMVTRNNIEYTMFLADNGHLCFRVYIYNQLVSIRCSMHIFSFFDKFFCCHSASQNGTPCDIRSLFQTTLCEDGLEEGPKPLYG